MKDRFGSRYFYTMWPCQQQEQLRLMAELSRNLDEDADGVSRYALTKDGRRIVERFDSDEVEEPSLMIGDVLCFNLKWSPFTHQAIFVGKGYVAHLFNSNRVDVAMRLAREKGYISPSPMNAHKFLACFCIQRLEDTLPKWARWRLGHCKRAPGITRQDVALRALQSVGAYVYNKVRANCQDAVSLIHGNTRGPIVQNRILTGIIITGLAVLLVCVFGLWLSPSPRTRARQEARSLAM